ncbi:MAG: hypothetical protein JWO56_1001 [Acidobacteria bacterium]|jgi:hypothetical protein|nr:hypothetical protein [Acidobacteriota bacterium]
MRGVVRRARGVSAALLLVVGLLVAQSARAADSVDPTEPSFIDVVLEYLEHIISIPPG